MTSLASRVFARLVLVAAALGGLLLLVAFELVVLGANAEHSERLSVRCLLAPRSASDLVVHGLAVGVSALAALGILVGVRAASRAYSRMTALQATLAVARLDPLPERLLAPAHRAGVRDRLDLVTATQPLAFAYGWLQPRICLSTALLEFLTEPELEAVLHHEGWHVARRDPLRFVIAQTVGAVFAVIPPIRGLVNQFLLAAEIAADRYTVGAMGHPRSLARALIKTMGSTVAAPGFTGQVEGRIAALAGEPPAVARWRGRLAAFVLLVELVVLLPVLANGSLIALVGFWSHPVC